MLILHQALWFGDRMKNSLINPNQCRAFGISLCDDPYDPHRELGLYDPQTDTAIPFTHKDSAVGLKTRSPTPEEIDQCRPHIILSDEAPWDPSKMTGDLDAEEKALYEIMSLNHYKPASQQRTPSAFDIGLSDAALASCSTAYCASTMIQRMVSSVQIASPLSDA